MCYVEGCLAKKGDIVWMIKGVEHPEGYLTAFPRYEVQFHKDRTFIKKLHLKKPEDYYKVLPLNPNFYGLAYNKCAGRETPLLRLGEIEKFFDPFRPILCEERGGSEPCLVFDYLSSQIENARIGLTGSSYFEWNPSSDIDVLVFTTNEKVDLVLDEIRRKTDNIDQIDALRIMEERGYAIQTLKVLERIRNSVGQRKVLGRRVFLRVLVNDPFAYVKCRHELIKDGEIDFTGVVYDERAAVFPYIYNIRVLESDFLNRDERITVVTERGKYSEMATKGSIVKVRGDFEVKIHENGGVSHQVYLWSDCHHLIPIS